MRWGCAYGIGQNLLYKETTQEIGMLKQGHRRSDKFFLSLTGASERNGDLNYSEPKLYI